MTDDIPTDYQAFSEYIGKKDPKIQVIEKGGKFELRKGDLTATVSPQLLDEKYLTKKLRRLSIG